jgi:hypothetical protein
MDRDGFLRKFITIFGVKDDIISIFEASLAQAG